MKRLLYILLCCVLLAACANDPTETAPQNEGEPVELMIRFGSQTPQLVQTRQTMPLLSDESKIYNIYVYIFDSDGRKIYGRYFDDTALKNSSAEVEASDSDAWFVTVPAGDSQDCEGTVKVNTISRTGCSIIMVANIDSKMVNISPEKLGLVQTQKDLLEMVGTLNQDFVERNGYFPMTGYLTDVNTAALTGRIPMYRMDAKINFTVKIADDSPIERFELHKWQVCNVSKDAYIMKREAREAFSYEGVDSQQNYFDTRAKNVEDQDYKKITLDDGSEKTIDIYGFSFYTLDNNLAPKATPAAGWTYADRERQEKGADGTNGAWLYANDCSTYVVLTGRMVMNTSYELMEGVVKDNCTLNADVRYVIHLGDFGKGNSSGATGAGYANFATERNTAYSYTITIYDPEDIRIEVETSNDDTEGVTESMPGETGDVTIALQEIYECDAHYSSHVMTFDQEYIKPEQVTWYVRTPFGEGEPIQVNGTDVTTGLDFRWVEFRINETTDDGTAYSDNRVLYIPHATRKDVDGNTYPTADGKTMYVDEVVAYLKKQKIAYDNGEPNDFKNGQIKMTAFVNEYYYDTHPITGTKNSQLWKRVVNQDDMRLMHILSDAKTSLDQESMVIGSSYTIQQKSIQTIYNPNAEGLTSAWGMEYEDDYPDLTYNSVGTGTTQNRGNLDYANGRLNTLREWELVGSTSTSFTANEDWGNYLNLTADNNTTLLHTADTHPDGTNREYLRWSCMARNRDNNGNGKIDAGEVRWYLASLRQLTGIWIGADALDNAARLYQRNAEQMADPNAAVWRQHVVSSTTKDNSNDPQLVWAEEGCSTGKLSESKSWGSMNTWSVRCVRNLGMDDSDEADLTAVPQDYVKMEGTDAAPVFNLEFLHEDAIGMLQENRDLVYADEHSVLNRVYWKFQATSEECPTFSSINFPAMQEELNGIETSRFCPVGYRLPNQREMALMHLYCADSFWPGSDYNCYTRTYYSFGSNGSNPKESAKTGWVKNKQNLFMEEGGHHSTESRCVRHVEVAK